MGQSYHMLAEAGACCGHRRSPRDWGSTEFVPYVAGKEGSRAALPPRQSTQQMELARCLPGAQAVIVVLNPMHAKLTLILVTCIASVQWLTWTSLNQWWARTAPHSFTCEVSLPAGRQPDCGLQT